MTHRYLSVANHIAVFNIYKYDLKELSCMRPAAATMKILSMDLYH